MFWYGNYVYHALSENIGITPASNLVSLSAGGEMLFEWHFAGGPIVARFYMLTGKWAGNGLSYEFISEILDLPSILEQLISKCSNNSCIPICTNV